MDYFFGDGVGEPTQWQGAPDLTLGAGAADALWLDFDGDGYADDALWDSDLDGVADRVVIDVGTGGQEVYSDEGGRGVWNGYVGGAGALVTDAIGGGSVVEGAVVEGAGMGGTLVGGSEVGGTLGGDSIGVGSLAAGSDAPGSMPDWGTLLAEAVGALDDGPLGSEPGRWGAPPVIEPEPAPPAGGPRGHAPPPEPDPAPQREHPSPVQGGTLPEPAPPVLEADGSLTVDTGGGLLSVADVDGDGHLDSARPVAPLPPTGAPDPGAVGGGSAAAGAPGVGP